MPFYRVFLSLIVALLVASEVKAQSFYKDSTTVVSLIYIGHEGFDYYSPGIIRESIYLDSVINETRYYRYQSSTRTGFRHELSLRVEDKKVYLSGAYNYNIELDYNDVDTNVVLTDYLLYDFNLNEGDTFWFTDPFGFGINRYNDDVDYFTCSGNDSFYVITKTGVVFDQITGDSFFTQECSRYGPGAIITSSQFGSSKGFMSHINFVEANLSKHFCDYISPLIGCIKSDLVFENATKSYNGYLTKYFKGDLCDSTNVADGYQIFLSAETSKSIENEIRLIPNPVVNSLHIESGEIFKTGIINSNGKTVKVVENETEIDVSELSSGVYTIWLSNNEKTVIRKLVKL